MPATDERSSAKYSPEPATRTASSRSENTTVRIAAA